MIDLVQAGPFTFCPSMFVAAYIEATETSSDTSTRTNSMAGSEPGFGNSTTSRTIGGVQGNASTTSDSVFAAASAGKSENATLSETNTKSTTANSVILVLTTGAYKAKTSDPQSVVTAIHTQVYAYFNSLP